MIRVPVESSTIRALRPFFIAHSPMRLMSAYEYCAVRLGTCYIPYFVCRFVSRKKVQAAPNWRL